MGITSSTPLANISFNTALPSELIDECARVAPRIFIRSPALGAEFARFYHSCLAKLDESKLKIYENAVEEILVPLRVTSIKMQDIAKAGVQDDAARAECELVGKKAFDKLRELNTSFVGDFVSYLFPIQQQTIVAFLTKNLAQVVDLKAYVTASLAATASDENVEIRRANQIASDLGQSIFVETEKDDKASAPAASKKFAPGIPDNLDTECNALYAVMVSSLLKEAITRPHERLIKLITIKLIATQNPDDAVCQTKSLLDLMDDKVATIVRKQMNC